MAKPLFLFFSTTDFFLPLSSMRGLVSGPSSFFFAGFVGVGVLPDEPGPVPVPVPVPDEIGALMPLPVPPDDEPSMLGGSITTEGS